MSNYSLFTRKTKNSLSILLVYVDDIILAGDSLQEIERNKYFLNYSFNIKDLGELKYFLGLKVSRSKKGIHLCQRKYAFDILEETGLLGSKPCLTPLMSNTKFLLEIIDKLHNRNPYRRLIGKLLYLTNIRLDITFVVQLLNQFVLEPTVHHQQVVQHTTLHQS